MTQYQITTIYVVGKDGVSVRRWRVSYGENVWQLARPRTFPLREHRVGTRRSRCRGGP